MKLDPEDRRAIGEKLLESVEEADAQTLSQEQRAELQRRYEEHLRDPKSSIPLEDVRKHVDQRLKELSARSRARAVQRTRTR
ncbi:MAG TPA: addiction module protein [Planctomycetota bacterium]|nr:addiction module protein [Planctomycetota bacterium]